MDIGNIRFPKFGASAVVGGLRAPGGIRGRGMRMMLGPQIPAPAAAAAAQLAVSTHTNDPSTANCRVFVGNLNTVQLTSDDVMEIFQKYGDVIAISVHKGYAFVQFTRTFEARNAAENEDGMIYASQRIDCNVASEPKPNAGGRKRPAAAAGYAANVKRNKMSDLIGLPTNRNLVEVSTSFTANGPAATSGVSTDIPASYSGEADILICGRCRSLFTSVDALLTHKQKQCKLLHVCQCEAVDPGIPYTVLQTYHELTCTSCQAKLPSPWALIKHLESKHGMAVCSEVTAWERAKENPQASASSSDVQPSAETAGKQSGETCFLEESGETCQDQKHVEASANERATTWEQPAHSEQPKLAVENEQGLVPTS